MVKFLVCVFYCFVMGLDAAVANPSPYEGFAEGKEVAGHDPAEKQKEYEEEERLREEGEGAGKNGLPPLEKSGLAGEGESGSITANPNQKSLGVRIPSVDESSGTTLVLPRGAEDVAADLLTQWKSPSLQNKELPERFAQAVQKVDLIATLENIRPGDLNAQDLENPSVQKELNEKFDVSKKLDATLKSMGDEAVKELAKFTVATPAEKVSAACKTLYAISRLRAEVAQEQRATNEYLGKVQKIRANRLRPVLEGFAFTAQDVNNPEKLASMAKAFESVATKLKETSVAPIIAEAAKQQGVPYEVQALTLFSERLKVLENSLGEKIETASTAELKAALKSLEDLQKQVTVTSKSVNTSVFLAQSKTFGTKIGELFSSLRKALGFIESGTFIVTDIAQAQSSGERPDLQAWQAFSQKLVDPKFAGELNTAYAQFGDRVNEFDGYINEIATLVQELQSSKTMDVAQKNSLIALRGTLESYLTALEESGKSIGVKINNPTAIGSHLRDFIKMWFSPTGEKITEEDLTLAGSASSGLGNLTALINQLDSQSKSAANLLKIIDQDILKQSSMSVRALYTVSFLGTISANVGAAAAWVGAKIYEPVNLIGISMDIKYQRIFLVAPVTIMAAALLLEGVAYGIQKGALTLAGSGNN